MPFPSITDFNNGKIDLDKWRDILQSNGNSVTLRNGQSVPTRKKLFDDLSAAAAITETGQNRAAVAEDRSAVEVARDAALAAARIYANTAAGLAATTPDQFFYVPSPLSSESLILYLNSAGAAAEQKRYLSSTLLTQFAPPGYAWALVDEVGNAAFGVQEDGTVSLGTAQIKDATFEQLTGDSLDVGSGGLVEAEVAGFAFAFADEAGAVALGIKDDGTVVAKAFEVDTINGAAPTLTGTVSRRGGVYSHQINFINNTGQSLGEGSTPAVDITTAQEYDNIGFPARASSPSAFVTLTTGNTEYSTRGESPMYGTLGFIKERILAENGIEHTINDYQLAACNNAYSGYSITSLNKGTAPYTLALSQVQAAYDIATAQGKSMSFQACTWTQGENDSAMAQATYKAHLIQLANDYNDDGKAITGQHNDVRLITYQCATAGTAIPVAQLEASNECALITMACPMYQFTYGDSAHIDSTSSKWLGGYYGLAYKRTVVDGQEWKPLQPVAHAVLGSAIDLIFNKNGLTLDTTLVPAQTNFGFSVKNGSGVVQTISSVEVLAPNRVRITVSGTPAAGWSVQYGFNSATGKSPFVGGCGNLRDSQGDSIVYEAISKPMHNWCVIFNYSI